MNRAHIPYTQCPEMIITGKTIGNYHNQTFFCKNSYLYYFKI